MTVETKIEIQWIRPTDLRTDESCQRKLDIVRAKRMARNWDQAKFEASLPLNGSAGPDGVTVYVTDGQHRQAALILRDDNDPIPVAVVHNTSKQQQAEQFLSLNGGRAPSTRDQHRIALLAGHQDALDVGNALEAAGVTTFVQAIDACYRVNKMFGTERLCDTLVVLTAAFGKARTSYPSLLIRAIATALANDADPDRLVTTLQGLPVLRWRQEAIKFGGMYKAICERYNRRIQRGRIS